MGGWGGTDESWHENIPNSRSKNLFKAPRDDEGAHQFSGEQAELQGEQFTVLQTVAQPEVGEALGGYCDGRGTSVSRYHH